MKSVLRFAAVGAILIAAIMLMPGALAATGHAASAPEPKMVGSQWAVYEEKTLPNGGLDFYPGAHATTMGTGGVEFTMPEASGASPTWVNYLEDTFHVALTERSVVTAQIQVVAEPTTSFVGDAFGGINPVTPAFVRLFLQANLPNNHSSSCTGGNGNVDNYWWADASAYTFTSGSGGGATMSVPLTPGSWSNICGESGAGVGAAFDTALAHVSIIGLSFGSGYFFASGVGILQAPATFELVSYTIA